MASTSLETNSKGKLKLQCGLKKAASTMGTTWLSKVFRLKSLHLKLHWRKKTRTISRLLLGPIRRKICRVNTVDHLHPSTQTSHIACWWVTRALWAYSLARPPFPRRLPWSQSGNQAPISSSQTSSKPTKKSLWSWEPVRKWVVSLSWSRLETKSRTRWCQEIMTLALKQLTRIAE